MTFRPWQPGDAHRNKRELAVLGSHLRYAKVELALLRENEAAAKLGCTKLSAAFNEEGRQLKRPPRPTREVN